MLKIAFLLSRKEARLGAEVECIITAGLRGERLSSPGCTKQDCVH